MMAEFILILKGSMRQKLLWVPIGVDTGAPALKCAPIPFRGKNPNRVWTLLYERDETKQPALPFMPSHNSNAFIEDCLHDWNIHNGKFYYHSHVTDGGVWVLLEYLTKKDGHL